MNRIFTTLLLVLCSCVFAAGAEGVVNAPQEAPLKYDFESMKSRIGEKSLPLVNITVDIASVTRNYYTQATIEIVDPLMRTDGNLSVTYGCKVKYRGATSTRYQKKSFAVKLLNEKGKSLDANILGMREDDSWILDAMAIDRIRMRNRVNFDTWNAMSRTPYDTKYDGRNGTLGFFVEVFVNGDYHGLYCMTDKVNRKLLGVDKAKEDADGKPIINGVMYKCAEWGDASYFKGYNIWEDMNKEAWNAWELDYPDDYPCETAYMPLKNFLDYCIYTTDEEYEAGLDENVYIDNFVDYHVFVLSQGLCDNTMKNSFLSIVNINDGHRMMITPWDLDTSLGGFWEGSYNDVVAFNETVLQVWAFERLWYLKDYGYQTMVADRWRTLRNTVLSDEAMFARLDDYASRFIESGAWAREYNKWNGNPVPLKENLMEEVEYAKKWYANNAVNMENVIFYGIESGIAAPGVSDNAPADGNVYNVMGQKVAPGFRGIVVRNGKKYFNAR